MLQRVARASAFPARRAGPAITPTVQPTLLRPGGPLRGLGAALLFACAGFAAGLLVASRRRR